MYFLCTKSLYISLLSMGVTRRYELEICENEHISELLQIQGGYNWLDLAK